MTTTTLQTDRFEVGQIVCSSYGYDMTLVQFYVVDRMTKASVWLRPVECRVFGDDGRGEGRAIPNTGWQAPDNAVFRKRIHETDGKQWLSDSIKYFRIWNGKPEYYNSWD
tara:strand:+ start:5378 stop:5707 length:330 start_codon:yes stop_codon:yes gene_type:complete